MPVLSRLNVETEVVSEVGPLLALAGKTATATGTNPDLNGPLAFALQALGVTPTNPAAVADSDVAALAVSQFTQICQLTEYFVLKKCINSLVMPNEMAQDRRQDWNEMVRRFQEQLNSLQAQYVGLLQIQTNPTVSGSTPHRFPTPACPAHWGLGHFRIDH